MKLYFEKTLSLLILMIFVSVSPAFTQTVTNVDGIRYLIEGNSAKAIDVEKDNIRYHLYETTKSAMVLNVDSKSVNVVIPETIEHEGVIYTVTKIGHISLLYGRLSSLGPRGSRFFISAPANVASRQEAKQNAPRLESITIPNSVTSIGQAAFEGCSYLKSIIIPNSVTSIGAGAFAGCFNLESVVIPGSVQNIDDFAFMGCTRLNSVIIEEGVKHIGLRAFRNCTSLKSIVIPNSVTDIEEGCFYECSKLSSVTLGDSIVSIPKGCFSQCKDLKIVKIGKNVKDIGEYAFSFCEVIEEIHINAENPPQIAECSLGTLSYTTLYVPNEFLENYKAIAPWRYAKKFVSADK